MAAERGESRTPHANDVPQTYEMNRRYDPALFSSVAAMELDMLDMDLDGREEFGHGRHDVAKCGWGTNVLRTAYDRTCSSCEGPSKKRCKIAMLAVLNFAALAAVIHSLVRSDAIVGDEAPDFGSDAGVAATTGGKRAEIPPPPSNLNDLCSDKSVSSTSGYDACVDACEPSACCHVDPDDFLSCLASNVDVCGSYEGPCHNLGTHTHEHVGNAVVEKDGKSTSVLTMEIPEPPGDMSRVCAPSALATLDGYNDCDEVCFAADCCASEHCLPSNPDLCVAYDPCSILSGTVASHPDSIKSLVKKECSTASLFDGGGVEKCRELCERSECCFASAADPNAPSPCRTDETEGWCSQYAPCQILSSVDADGFNSHEEAASAVDAACKDKEEKDLAACMDLCTAGVCCFEETEECKEEVGKVDIRCEHYASCAVVFDQASLGDDPSASQNVVAPNDGQVEGGEVGGTGIGGDDSEYDEDDSKLAKQVEEACKAGDAPVVPAAVDACLGLCKDRACCFPDDLRGPDCRDDPDMKCEMFKPCQDVLENADGKVGATGTGKDDGALADKEVAKTVEEACSGSIDGISVEMDYCLELCIARACCFPSEGSSDPDCQADPEQKCSLFAPCQEFLERVGNDNRTLRLGRLR